jgi:outer membrane biosynthesis protein TonB
MSRLGGEKISRLVVGLFALVLTGGLAAFFGGYLDPLLGTQEKTVVKPPMPFAKPPAYPPKTAAVDSAPATAVATVNAPAKVATPSPTVTPTPVAAEPVLPSKPTPKTEVVVPVTTESIIAPSAEKTTAIKTTPKPLTNKPARQRDLDLRSCLELTDNLAIAQCAYKLP